MSSWAIHSDSISKLVYVQIKEIQISRTPDKVNYFCGTAFDPTGLTVYSLTNGGDFTKVKLDDCTITGFDSSVPVENQVVTVTYKGFTATFNVSIKEQLTTAPQLESIAIGTMPKTEYKLGDPLRSKDGTFICTYTDGTTKTYALSNKYVYGFVAAMESGVPGEYELTVKYTEKGVTAETTYKITISE